MNLSSLNRLTVHKKADIALMQDVVSQINMVIMLFGIIGNVLCIYVFAQKRMIKRKFYFYLLILAICELIFCLVLFLDYSYRFTNRGKITLHDSNLFMNITIEFLIHTTDSYSGLITLILSIDRLYAIRNPMKIKKFITNLHSKCLLLSTLAGLILIKIPGVLISFQIESELLFLIFCVFLFPAILNIIPTVAILLINSILIKEVNKYLREFPSKSPTIRWSQNKSTTNESVNSRTQKSYYFVIIFLSFWLVCTTLPYYLFKTFSLFYRFSSASDYFYFERVNSFKLVFTQVISSILLNSNHSINFFVYFHFFAMFRHGLNVRRFLKRRKGLSNYDSKLKAYDL